MDANQKASTGQLSWALIDPSGLAMSAGLSTHRQRDRATISWGSKPIDAIWVTQDIQVTNMCVLPLGYGVGDHRMFVLDITNQSMTGATNFLIQHPPHRWISSQKMTQVHCHHPDMAAATKQSLKTKQQWYLNLAWMMGLNLPNHSTIQYFPNYGIMKIFALCHFSKNHSFRLVSDIIIKNVQSTLSSFWYDHSDKVVVRNKIF